MSRFTNDMDTVSEMINSSFASVVSCALTFIGIVVMMLYMNWVLTLITFAFLVLMLLVVKGVGGRSRVSFQAQQQALGAMNGYIEEMVEGQKVIKVFNHESKAIAQFSGLNDSYRDAATAAQTYSGAMMPAMANLSRIDYAVTCCVGGLLAIGGVVLTLNIPKVLGNATDEIMVGLMKQNVYDAIEEVCQASGISPSDYLTMADFLDAVPGGSQMIENIPPQYQDDLLGTSLQSRPGVDLEAVGQILLLLAGLILFSALLSYLQNFLMSGVAQKISYRLRDQINRKMNKLPLSFYDKTTHGEVLSLITNDVDTVSTTLNQSLTQMITAVTTLVGVLVMMLSISGWMTLVALVALPLSFFFISRIVRRSQKYFRAQQEYLGHVNGHIEEMYSNRVKKA